MTFFEELQWRGLIHSITDEALIDILNNGHITFYLGADPTGDSLHVGHLLVYLFSKRLELHGHTPIFLIGGATSSIGDPKPGGERTLLSREEIEYNGQKLYEQVLRMFNCEMVNNYDWTHKIDVLSFLRNYGKYFNVNYMITKETVKARLDSGISYAEFSYQILQALDFEYLYRTKKCQLQIGGQDQWGNITGGLELIRKMNGADAKAYGLTVPLLTKSDGQKFGKTESGAVWLDPKKTTPYAFYQFWYNTPDEDVISRLKQFTFLSKEEIEALEESLKTEPHLRKAQKALAAEVTRFIHGEEALLQAVRISEALFSGEYQGLSHQEIQMAFESLPVTSVEPGTGLIDALVLAKAAVSKREARTFITNGAISVNGKVVDFLEATLEKDNTVGDTFVVIRRGKKNYYLVELSQK